MDKNMKMRKGLTEAEASRLLKEYGLNELKHKKNRSAVGLFLSQFCDVLVLMLAAATLFSFVIGQYTEAVTIIAVVLLNTVMGFVQEFRTEKTLANLKKLASPVARVVRSGRRRTIDATLVVPGDLIFLRSGDRVPADCELCESAGLSADESILTGESAAVDKDSREAAKLFMGTSVLSGHGEAVVTRTGMSTAMGGIAALLDDEKEPPTPLQKRLSSLGKFIAVTCVFCSLAVVGIGLARGENLFGLTLTGISLAVAAIPEGLPAVVTIVLALSVGRLLAKHAVIRKLPAVETLGCASVICTDKTGTLTENIMTACEFYADGKRYSLSGSAGSQSGNLTEAGRDVPIASAPILRAALECGALCSTSSVEPKKDGLLERSGSPTETALLVAAYKCGITRDALLSRYAVIEERPFDSRRKFMSVQVERGKGRAVLLKGAPGVILARCSLITTSDGIRQMTTADRGAINAAATRMAGGAMRVIALAAREGAEYSEDNLAFIALAGLVDPPRTEVTAAVQKCRRAGVRIIMITGDHPLTARAIAQKTGILREGMGVCEGPLLESMDESELASAVRSCDVFARVSPEHKLRIVRALRAQGNVVAMTGDGVNDAPAVRAADIGVAMGIAGSDVTKEAASLVVLDDNFATIVAAVEEGRVIYDNIRRFIRFLLTSNLGEVLTVLLAMAVGMPAVFIPIQILLINLVTDSLPAVALGMEGAGSGVMHRPPRPESEGLFAKGLAFEIVFRGAVMGLANLLTFTTVLRITGDIVCARSAAFITLILAQMIHVFECKLDLGERLTLKSLLSNHTLVFACALSVVAAVSVVYLPVLQNIFFTSHVGGIALLTATACALISPLMGMLSEMLRKTIK